MASKLSKEHQHHQHSEDATWICQLHPHNYRGNEIYGLNMPLLLFGDKTDEETQET